MGLVKDSMPSPMKWNIDVQNFNEVKKVFVAPLVAASCKLKHNLVTKSPFTRSRRGAKDMPRDQGHFEFKWNRPMIKEKEVVNFYDLVNLYRGEEGDGLLALSKTTTMAIK